jgi:toxin ParE1/3/4
MKFKLTRKAKSDLDDIWNYTQIRWGAEQADIYIDILYNRFLWLTRNPSLWRQRDDIVEGLYSYHESSHIIFFRRYDKGIEIVRILHGRMDVQRHL